MATNESSYHTISAIFPDETELEDAIDELEQKIVGRHELSVQGKASALKATFGEPYVDPRILQNTPHPPMREPFLEDDFGWAIGLVFMLPIFVGAALSVFFLGMPELDLHNFIMAVLGGLIGGFIGSIFSQELKIKHHNQIAQQEKKGGFVLWVNASSVPKQKQILSVLKKYHADSIRIN